MRGAERVVNPADLSWSARTRRAPGTPVPIANPPGPCPVDIGVLHDLKGETRSIPKGAHVRLRRRDPEFAVLVLSGLLFRYVQTHNGSRQIVAFYFPGDWASVEALVGAPLEGEIAAVTRAKVRLIPPGEIRELGKTPRIFRSLTIETLFQAGVQSAWLTRNSVMPAVASLAHFLCEMIIRSGAARADGTVSCSFPLTQPMIAETLGLTPVHVNRTLRVLRERRLADLARGILRVNSLRDLAAAAEFDPLYLEPRSTTPSAPPGTRIS
jgi:CRP-like cAMP-binding protein